MKWDFIDYIIGLLITIVVAILLITAGLIIKHVFSPDLVTLKKNEWVCTVSHTNTVLVPMVSGEVTILMPVISQVCEQYNPKRTVKK